MSDQQVPPTPDTDTRPLPLLRSYLAVIPPDADADDVPTPITTMHLPEELHTFYAVQAHALGVSTDTLIRLVLVSVKTVLESEQEQATPTPLLFLSKKPASPPSYPPEGPR